MYSKVSVLIPTRGRVKRLRTLLESYEKTSTGIASELVFRADEDDLDTQRYLSGWRMIVGPRLQGYRSLPIFYNEMADAASGDVLMCGNDDMVFKTLGWPALVLAEANKYPDGIFNLGVRTYNEDHYPFSIISKKTAETLGFFWDPRIFWGDIFLRDVMGTLGRSVMIQHVEIEHDWVGHRPDETFLAGDQTDIYQRDPTYWAGTHATAVTEAVQKLRG